MLGGIPYFFQAVLHSLTVLDIGGCNGGHAYNRGPSESEGLPGKNRDVYKRQEQGYTAEAYELLTGIRRSTRMAEWYGLSPNL